MLFQFSFIVSLMTSSWYMSSTISYGSWITLLGWDISFSILYDQISIPLTLIVGIASSIIIPFAREYICDDPNLWYFMNLLLTFTSFMLILTSYDNLVIIFVGWEGVGLISYLLISFWSHRRIAIRSAMKAILINRVGDIFYVALIFRIISHSNSTDISIIYFYSPFSSKIWSRLLRIMVIRGASSKSAQLVLHTWLPDAIEGPTPVSALIHAATMVTAGIYLLLRLFKVIRNSEFLVFRPLWIGMRTAVFSAIIGLTQIDLKRLVAFSTGSQLGLMATSLCVSNISYLYTLYHLLIHAFFKAGLFLSCGVILHLIFNMQDMRHMGISNFCTVLPTIFTVTSLSLIALPIISGSYSKEFILMSLYSFFYIYRISFFICNLTSLLSSWYSIIIVIYLFFISPTIPSLFLKRPLFGYPFLTEIAIFSILRIILFSGIFIHFVGPITFSQNNVLFSFLLLTPLIFTLVGASVAIIRGARRLSHNFPSYRMFSELFVFLVFSNFSYLSNSVSLFIIDNGVFEKFYIFWYFDILQKVSFLSYFSDISIVSHYLIIFVIILIITPLVYII